ncbi:MAG: NAD(P)H-dependent oxidoreductase [Actinobacteria bacterium]|nr:NAD(P)H-dependent oxidoreductase [Actinomycetota bacterium]
MLVVGINGSPNEDGNTAFLIREVLRSAAKAGAKTELLHSMEVLEDQDKPYCDACSSPCDESCYVGTRLESALDAMAGADAIVVGSPVYFGTVSAQLKAIFDKSRALRAKKALVAKVGAGVSVGASRFGGQETTIRAIHDIMMVHGMTIVSDSSATETIGHHGVCAQRPAESDADALKSARVTGKRLVEEIKINRR